MDERHGFLNAIKSQKAFSVVHINADAGELLHVQRRLHVAVPGGEGASIPLEAPGKVVSGDAAVALAALAVDALVRDADVRALATDVHLKIMPSQVETLLSQDLAPTLEALRLIWIRMLPGCCVRHLPVFSGQTQELVGSVGVKAQVGRIWRSMMRNHIRKVPSEKKE